VDHRLHEDAVERAVGERQALGLAFDDPAAVAPLRDRGGEHLRRAVEAHRVEVEAPRQRDRRRARPAPDVEQRLAAGEA